MISTYFITSLRATTIVICLVGLPWAVNIWIPYALIGIEISRSTQDLNLEPFLISPNAAKVGFRENEIRDSTGAVLSVHNAAIALPQIFATSFASLLFWCMGSDGLRWVIVSGGVAALGASITTLSL
jgi:solute carrier family 45 protein 1/2/4